MRVADGAGERIRGIGRGLARQIQEAAHHVLHLLLRRVAVTHDRLLHLERGVLRDRQAGDHRRADRGAARLAERERRCGVDVDEDFFQRDLPGLISTLTPDCVYELVQTGHRWAGHEGAARFYTQLLTAFPDIRFDLTDIVIGPQGVCEEADVSATHQAEWLGVPPTGEHLQWKVVIWFPWDPEARLFRGERVHVFGLDVPALTPAA